MQCIPVAAVRLQPGVVAVAAELPPAAAVAAAGLAAAGRASAAAGSPRSVAAPANVYVSIVMCA